MTNPCEHPNQVPLTVRSTVCLDCGEELLATPATFLNSDDWVPIAPTKRNFKLWLSIEEYICACGNRWTHSELLLPGGCAPLPGETGTIDRVTHISDLRQAQCFRCVDMTKIALGYKGNTP